MADKLTPQQEQAVYNRGGKLLVSAAAGSGKTKVLVDRLLTYLTDDKDPANLDEFLIITYTKAAASELRGKIAAKLTERIAREPENIHLQKQMQRLFLTKISTVHGFCSDLLREYAYRLDIAADFRVADESECREIRETVLDELLDRMYAGVDTTPFFHEFIDSQGLGRDDRLIPTIIEKVYDSARCHLKPDAWLGQCVSSLSTSDMQDVSATVWGRYLIDDLHAYVDAQIAVMEQCANALEKCDSMEKPAANLRSTIAQLEVLRNANTWDTIVEAKSIDYGRLTFPRKNPDPDLTERVKAARTACKKGLEKKLHNFSDQSDQILKDLSQVSGGTQGLIALVTEFDKAYSAAKRSRRCLDFSDLEQKTLDLLLGKSRTNPTTVATEVGRRFREIMVDEYQDSNGVQDAIFNALSCERQNCFLVGDVKQSIYQFRLADPGIFIEKYQRYAAVEDTQPGEGRKVLLSHNFRSGAEVIDCVNDVFSACMSPKVGGLYYGEAEALREGIPHDPLPDPAVELYAIDVQTETYREEAAFVAQKIKSMLSDGTVVRANGEYRPVEPDDIVILLRSPGSAGSYFQHALEAQGIRCTSGGGADLLKTEEVATLRSFLKVILNPRQDIPLISVLASPLFGFTANDLAVIRSIQKKGSVYDALCKSENPKSLRFRKFLDMLRHEARMQTLSGLLEKCFITTRLDSIYAAMRDGDTRQKNLQLFYQLAVEFEKGSLSDISQFLDHLDALEERGLAVSGTSVSGCVNIMSIHKSKGLEFPVVFLCNLSRKFNQESLRAQILCDKELGLGLSVANHEKRIRYPSLAKRAISVKMAAESVSEEMRVLYVAMTRARDRLIMTYAAQNLQKDLQELSLRQDFDNGDLLCQEAICLGDWVLMSAIRKTEAGELHVLGGRPAKTNLSRHPWKIRVVKADSDNQTMVEMEGIFTQMPAQAEAVLGAALGFSYPHMAATQAPSKQTATDRKGRLKDVEAAEQAQERKSSGRTWRQPSFVSKKIEGKAYGSAIHAAMQYIHYENCGSVEEIHQEIDRLVQQGFLTDEQGKLVNCEKLAGFFSTEMGQKLRQGIPHLREFKFSILDDGTHYAEGLEGEQVLLQGVVDCAILEDDGITILDFKTDYVTEKTLPFVVERYRPQVETYAEALGRIYEKQIKGSYLYFFHLDRFVPIK